MPTPAYVGRYDLDGNQIWLQELLLDLSAVSEDPKAPDSVASLAVDPDGNPVVALSGLAPVIVSGTTYELRNSVLAVSLKKSDGKLL